MPKKTAYCRYLNLSIPQEVADFLLDEKEIVGGTKTSYINSVLTLVSKLPTFFSTSSSKIEELESIGKFLNDPVLERIPEMAEATRRDPLKMLLYVLDKGLEAIDQSERMIAERASHSSQYGGAEAMSD